jgi:hypothetical protein
MSQFPIAINAKRGPTAQSGTTATWIARRMIKKRSGVARAFFYAGFKIMSIRLKPASSAAFLTAW